VRVARFITYIADHLKINHKVKGSKLKIARL
jgi:hypothetical protein